MILIISTDNTGTQEAVSTTVVVSVFA
jgi:hypothetical protein